MFNLHSTKCIIDSCYLSLHQWRDLHQQNFIHKLLLFKLVWEQRQLYLNNLSSGQFPLRLINISEVTWSSLWSIDYFWEMWEKKLKKKNPNLTNISQLHFSHWKKVNSDTPFSQGVSWWKIFETHSYVAIYNHISDCILSRINDKISHI